MTKLLRSSDTGASIREKVPISHNRVYEKQFPCVGFSSSTVPIIIKGESATVAPVKRAKLMDGSLTTHCSTRYNEAAHVTKSAEMNSMESQIFHPLTDPRQNCRKLPKGVLKIRTSCSSHIDGSKGMHHGPGVVLVDQLGMQSCSFYAPPHAFAHDVCVFSENSSSHTNTINGTPASSRQSPLQWKGTQETCDLMDKGPLGVQMTVPEEQSTVYPSMMLRSFYQPESVHPDHHKLPEPSPSAANHSLAYSSEAYETRECGHMNDLLKNSGHQNNIVHQSSPDPCVRGRDGHETNGYTTMHSLRNAESISEMLNLGPRIYPPHNNFTEQLETLSKCHDSMKLDASPAKPVIEVEEAQRFAYTYARRKIHKRTTMAGDVVSPSVLHGMANVKAKAIKL